MTWPCRWSTGASGSRRAAASAFAADTPTSSAPISPGPARDRDLLDVGERRARPLERVVDDRVEHLEVLARGDLRHHAAVALVQQPLRRDHVGADRAVARDERGAGVVAAGLDAEDHAVAARSAGTVRHMIRASSRLSW